MLYTPALSAYLPLINYVVILYIQVNRILKKGNIGIANMHKKYRRQDRDPGWLGQILAR